MGSMFVATNAIRAALVVSLWAATAVAALAAPPNQSPIPNFAPNSHTSWALDQTIDDLLPPSSGPGPITFDPAHPYIPNFRGAQPTYRVADLTNPILQPWIRERMRRANDEVLAGKVPFRARERCWPIGVPGFVIYSLIEGFYFLQTPHKVTIINPGGPEVRQILMNVPHSADPKPSWYGESIGHYEGDDTLVIDTIGITDKTFVDNYRTPHTTELHVVERLKLTEGGSRVQISVTVDDPGAFTIPWSATQRWRRVDRGPLSETPCNENNANYFQKYGVPTPTADRPDF
ncbi:MAG TPA: hypothetical protein VLJ17_04340 [Xanthobacteraceae bacterium]|nr:hypothetical protein [Xanthobacteraceae bacterium]